MHAQSVATATIVVSEYEAWMIYRYLPSTAYNGAREFLLQVFKVIVGTSIEDLSWLKDIDVN